MFGDRVFALTYAPLSIGFPVMNRTTVVSTAITMKKYVPEEDAIAWLRYSKVRSL